MHVWPQIPFGTAMTKSGALMASSDFAKIRFYGKSAHCSQQEKGNNALLSAVDMVSAFKEIKDAIGDDNTLLFCGSIHSGVVHNIVPDFSEIFATIRTYSQTQRTNIKEQLLKTANTIANHYGTTAKLEFEGGCPPVLNDESIVKILSDKFGVENNATSTLAGEDFSYFGNYAPSCMIWLGIGDTPPLHNEKFFVPLDALKIGADLWLKIANFNWEDKLS
jgi:hippurate hydrolase